MKLQRNHFAFLVLALAIALVYGRSLFYPLLWWDDRQHICQNPFFWDPNWARWNEIWTEPYFGLYAPLAYTFWFLPLQIAKSFWTDCMSFGPPFHGFNLILHFSNTLLVYFLLQQLKKSPTVSLLGALIYSLHPLQVETVAWVSAERDLLSAFFGFAALNLFLRKKIKVSWLFFALSCFAKASGTIFPLLAGLLTLANPETKSNRKESLKSLTPAFVFSVAAALFAKSIQADRLLKFQIDFWERPLVFLQALGFYFWKTLAPFQLAPTYDRSITALQNNSNLYAIGFLALAIGALAVWLHRLRLPFVWMAVALLPFSGLISFGFQETSTVADRYFSVSLFGLALLLSPSLKKQSIFFVSVIATALGILSFQQVGYWQNDQTLFQHNVELYPEQAVAHGNLANALFHQEQYTPAEKEFLRSLELDPTMAQSWLGLARTYQKTGRPQDEFNTYQKSIQAKVALPETYNNLAVIYYTQKDLAAAEQFWKTAAKQNPNYFEPRYNLGILYLEQNRKAEAKRMFEESLAVAPGNPQALEKLRAL